MEDHSGGAPMTQLSDRQGRVSFHDAVGAEKHLQAHSLKGGFNGLLTKRSCQPESPLLFLRDLICKRPPDKMIPRQTEPRRHRRRIPE